jgi:hypothetical protein
VATDESRSPCPHPGREDGAEQLLTVGVLVVVDVGDGSDDHIAESSGRVEPTKRRQSHLSHSMASLGM